MKKLGLICMLLLFLINLNAAGIHLDAKQTNETKVEPIYINKINATAEGKDVEGLLFIFEITKLNKDDKVFYFQELKDFKINNKSYAQITKEKLDLEIEPETELLESFKLIERNPAAKKIVKNEKDGLIMQTEIYGAKFPKSGIVSVTVQIGWAELNDEKTEMISGKLEDFVFEFEFNRM